MASSSTLPLSERDIRSSSVPRLRHASQRAKYGGPPPTDSFLIDQSRFPRLPALGKPKTDLTPAQRFRVAHDSVGCLTGKHLNKSNQHTGDRNPWNYWGPGRRWAKQAASGKDVHIQDGVRILLDEERVEWELEQEALSRSWDEQYEHARFKIRSGSTVLDSDEVGPMSMVQAMRDVDGVRKYQIKVAKRKRSVAKERRWDEDWHSVGSAEDHGDSDTDDSWDDISVCSAPG